METSEFLEIVARGEDSTHQFKANVSNNDSLASELVAFSNSGGGVLIIGVDNFGQIVGLNRDDVGRINLMVSNVSSQHIHDPISPRTENLALEQGLVMIVTVQNGIRKPYRDNSGVIWVKNGSDKRRVTSNEEIQRMLQASGLIHADEIPVPGTSVTDVDQDFFRVFFNETYDEDLENVGLSSVLLENMNLAKDRVLNLAGTLLFAANPVFRLPAFIIKAVAFAGNDIEDTNYLDSRDLSGKLSDMFQKAISFLVSNVRGVQVHRGFNSLGEDEIPRVVFEEFIANALIHRDYFISAPVKVLVFRDRIEIVSPGHLPNSLTVENIKFGISNMRNPVLGSFAIRLLPYRGIGSGVRRALKAYSRIDLVDDRVGNQFTVIIRREPPGGDF